MKKIKTAIAEMLVLAAGLLAPLAASAQVAAPAAPAPDWTITGNAGLFSDYRFRGISQTNKEPAFQGGFDIAHSSGFYVGNWNSNIDSDFFNGGNLEMDFYGGYKLPIGDTTLDFGVLHYFYPGSNRFVDTHIKNTEVYVGAAYGPVSAKFYYPISDFFSAEDLVQGGKNAGGSFYIDVSGAYDLGQGWGVAAHVGYQKLKGDAKQLFLDHGTDPTSNYVDWKLGGTYTFANGFVAGLAYVATNRDYQGAVNSNGNSKNISKSTAVVSLSKTF